MAIDKKLQIFDDEGNPVDYDILASDVKFNDGKDLPTKLDEMEDEIGEGGYTPPQGGIPKTDLAQSVQDTLDDVANKVDKVTGKGLSTNDYTTEEKTKLDGLPTNPVTSISVNGGTAQTPTNGNVNLVIETGGETVVINSDGANIVDSHNNPSILVAPSARQMYMAAQNINTLFTKVNDLYDKLAGIAFADGKPANWKVNANWSTPAIPTHTITLGTMTNVSASLNGTTINGSTSTSEGEVTILLTPSGNNYMGTISIKDVNNNDVNFTQTDVTGGTEITFILSGNVTISASASSGIQVNVSGTGITSYTTGVQPNTAAQLTIALPEHHTWGTVTVSYGGTDITSQCTISQANNADKVITLPNTLSDMSKAISIVANAVEDNHAVLNLSNVGSGVTVNHQNNEHLYEGDTITILPASGNKVTASATIGGNAATLTGDTYAGYSYTIGSGDVSSIGTAIAITASATELQTFSIDLTGLVGVTSSNAATSIVEGSSYSTTLSKTDSSASGSVIVGTCTMGSESIAPSSGLTISVDHVTGNITLAATVGELPTKVHSYIQTVEADSQNRACLLDKTSNGFNLYDKNVATGISTSNIYSNRRSSGTLQSYAGDLALPVDSGDFTIHIGGYTPGFDSNATYASYQWWLNTNTENAAGSNGNEKNVDAGGYSAQGGYNSALGVMIFGFNTGQSLSGTARAFVSYTKSGGRTVEYFNNEATAPTNEKTSVTIVYNRTASTMKMYKNGVQVGTTATISLNLSIRGLCMPTTKGGQNPFTFDCVEIYNYAMTDAQVAELISNNE